MKYVPSISPPRITGVGEGVTVTGLAAVKAVKPVQPRTLPPLVTPPHEGHEPAGEVAERRHDPKSQGERRTYCRRLRRLSMLVELRSGLERRHRNQREGDQIEHVDIKA